MTDTAATVSREPDAPLYAVERKGISVVGFGRTPEEALEDAREWVEAGTDLSRLTQLGRFVPNGRLRLIPITHALTVEVCRNGPSTPYSHLRDGTLCTHDEDRAERAAAVQAVAA